MFAHPDVPHPSVSGFTGAHRYYWLPAPEGQDYSIKHLKPPADATSTSSTGSIPSRTTSTPSATTSSTASRSRKARTRSRRKRARPQRRRHAIAIEVPVLAGRVIFVPALAAAHHAHRPLAFAANLVSAIRNTLLTTADGSAPEWVAEETLPGIEDSQRTHPGRRSQAGRARSRAGRRPRRVPGHRPLPPHPVAGGQVRLRVAGARRPATARASGNSRPSMQPGHFSFGSVSAFVEAESSAGAVGMDPHYRLRARLKTKIADDGRTPPHGIVIVNGFRETAPAEREQQYTNALRVASESMRYCIVRQPTCSMRCGEAGRQDRTARRSASS